jgi:mono/diheme cytochrome c family protein
VVAGGASADTDLVEEGRRLYHDGLRADGTPIEGRRPGGPLLAGRDLACVQCHRPSGMGTVEGVTRVPPVAGETLFAPGRPPAGHRPRRAPGMAFEDHAFRTRPAYAMASLARALRDGVGAGGAAFDPTMPRYRLADREIAALAAYLRQLGAVPPPGLEAGVVHLATVVAPDVPERQQQAMLDVLTRCIASHSPAEGSGRRAWKLHEWRLAGPASGWRRQLAEHQRRTPAFALVGGIGREWAPVHAFCEAEGMPCLFPNTDAPGPAPAASIYLWPGVALEGRLAARHLLDRPAPPRRLVQVFAADDIGRHAAAAAHAAMRAERPHTRRVDVAPGAPLPTLGRDDALLLWLTPAQLRAFAARPPRLPAGLPVLVSATLGELERAPDAGAIRPISGDALRVIHPFDASEARLGRMVFNLGGWMSGAGLNLTRETERTQGNTWSACLVAARALYTLPEPASRAALLERVEDAYAGAVSTAFPRFTLGPGQRYGSKGGYLMRVGADGSLVPDGDWTVP